MATPSGPSALPADSKFTTIKEGLAYILVPIDVQTSVDPKSKVNGDSQPQSVFYNPIQQFNRDLSVLAIRAYGEDLIQTKSARVGKSQSAKRKKARKAKVETTETAQVVEVPDVASVEQDGVGAEVNGQKRTPEEAELEEQEEKSNKRPKTVEPGTLDTEMIESKNGETTETSPTQTLQKKPQPPIKFRVLDALSATGLRALRYSHELPFVTHVTANDLSSDATKSIQANVAHNKLEDKIKVVTGNALAHMYSLVNLHTAKGPSENQNKYDVVDLDPYGTAAPFLDASIQAINDGGLLCVTCTDAALFASVGYAEKTYAQYGGMPIKGLHSHEGGLRLILHSIATIAAKYGMSIEPLLSLSIDFYARVFVRVFRSPAEVKFLAGKTMLVYSCDSGCGSWQPQYLARYTSKQAKNGTLMYSHSLGQGPTASPYCEFCGFKTHISGPMYGGPLHNPAFIEAILNYLPDLDKSTYATTARIEGMLSTALEETLIQGDPEAAAKQAESKTDEDKEEAATTTSEIAKPSRLVPRMDPAEQDRHPFFFFPSALAKVLHSQAPSEAALKGALRHAGYRAVRSHCKPGAIRTDAPWAFIWEMMREWVRQKAPIKEDSIKPLQAGWKIWHRERAQAAMQAHAPQGGEEDEGQKAVAVETETFDAEQKPDGDRAGEAVAAQGKAKDATAAKTWEIVFDEQLGREGGRKRLVRYQMNPRANWGPMVRAKKGAKA